jgi:hypothetical protein
LGLFWAIDFSVSQECKLDELRDPPTYIRRHNDGIKFA